MHRNTSFFLNKLGRLKDIFIRMESEILHTFNYAKVWEGFQFPINAYTMGDDLYLNCLSIAKVY